MILVHAGNRVDAADRGGPSRFPESQVGFVEERLARLLDALRPRVVVSAAAAGADLLLLEKALSTEGVGEVHVVLPFSATRFRETSVADRGGAWTERYDRVLSRVQGREGSGVYPHDESPDDAGFRAGNRLLVEHAQQVADGDGVLALAVRPRPGDTEPSITDNFVAVARLHDLTVIDIDPRVRKADMRRAFVAMPFGEKRYKRRKVNCDATFDKVIVPVLEDADLAWEREDRRLDAGIIHVGMIERLGNAHIVVVDTITQNANVFYELGLRHAFQRPPFCSGPRAPPHRSTPAPSGISPTRWLGRPSATRRPWKRSGRCSRSLTGTTSSRPVGTVRCSSSSRCRPSLHSPGSSSAAGAARRRGSWPSCTGA
jgi:hypothetical protein